VAKPKKIAAKSKAKTSKYTKLMKAASKELADKKKALIKAEKALATATKNHQEIVQEVARLDMLERSLKALAEGTEPPQNVRYVYNYPQWVWSWPNYYPNGGYTIPNTGQWTFTTQPPTFGTLTGGLNNGGTGITTSNGQWNGSTVSCTLANANSGLTLNSGESLVVNTVATSLSGTNSGQSGQVLELNNHGIQWVDAPSDGSFVVDLTTHSEPDIVGAKGEVIAEVETLV